MLQKIKKYIIVDKILYRNKMKNVIKITTIILIMLFAFESYAYNVVAIGKATIKNMRLRDAYYSAMNNAKLASIRWYYKENQITDVEVNEDYLKFIKSYSILEQNIEDNKTVSVKLKIDLDDTALKDARLLLNQYADSVVYLYRGIDDNILPAKQIQTTINNTLSAKQFSLADQALFLGKLDDINDESKITKAFNDINSTSLIIFDFRVIESIEEYKNPDNKCEVETTVSIYNKKNDTKTIQIVTGNDNSNITKCINNAIKQSAADTVAYVRDNIIQLPETAAKLYKYNIDFNNANNLVLTKNIIDTLSQRGLIKSYKTISYSQKNVVFEVDTYFSTEDLGRKIQELKFAKQPTKIEFNDKKLILDFSVE